MNPSFYATIVFGYVRVPSVIMLKYFLLENGHVCTLGHTAQQYVCTVSHSCSSLMCCILVIIIFLLSGENGT